MQQPVAQFGLSVRMSGERGLLYVVYLYSDSIKESVDRIRICVGHEKNH